MGSTKQRGGGSRSRKSPKQKLDQAKREKNAQIRQLQRRVQVCESFRNTFIEQYGYSPEDAHEEIQRLKGEGKGIVAEAQAKASDMIQQATEFHSEVREKADENAERVIAEAEDKAATIIADATAEGQRINEEVNEIRATLFVTQEELNEREQRLNAISNDIEAEVQKRVNEESKRLDDKKLFIQDSHIALQKRTAIIEAHEEACIELKNELVADKLRINEKMTTIEDMCLHEEKSSRSRRLIERAEEIRSLKASNKKLRRETLALHDSLRDAGKKLVDAENRLVVGFDGQTGITPERCREIAESWLKRAEDAEEMNAHASAMPDMFKVSDKQAPEVSLT